MSACGTTFSILCWASTLVAEKCFWSTRKFWQNSILALPVAAVQTFSRLLLVLYFCWAWVLSGAAALQSAFNLASNVAIIDGLAGFLLSDRVVFTSGLPMAIDNIAGNILGSRIAIARWPELGMLLISLYLLLITLVARYYF
jgi:hypothetical protein